MTEPYKISRVHWLDSNAVEGWHKVDDIELSGAEVHSVGFLIYEDDSVISLAKSVTGASVGDVLNIVKSAIVDRWEL